MRRPEEPRTRIPPPRPTQLEERLSWPHFRLFSPRLRRMPWTDPPPALHPFEVLRIPRSNGHRGALEATWFPATGRARGAVLLLPPWTAAGRAYFHRRGRIAALRRAGYHALALEFSGFGDSGPAVGFPDRDVESALDHLDERAPGLPHHVWGVSAGGYWSHLALSRRPPGAGVLGAMFEDVAPHLLEWSWRVAPWGRPAYLALRLLYPRTYRFLDLRRHAPALRNRLRRVAYVAGEADPCILSRETRRIAAAAGAQVRVIPGAGHLESIKRANAQVLSLALETFATAETAGA